MWVLIQIEVPDELLPCTLVVWFEVVPLADPAGGELTPPPSPLLPPKRNDLVDLIHNFNPYDDDGD